MFRGRRCRILSLSKAGGLELATVEEGGGSWGIEVGGAGDVEGDGGEGRGKGGEWVRGF